MDDKKSHVDEAHRIASDAVDAMEAFATAAVSLPVDSAKLTLDMLKSALAKVENIVKNAAGSDK